MFGDHQCRRMPIAPQCCQWEFSSNFVFKFFAYLIVIPTIYFFLRFIYLFAREWEWGEGRGKGRQSPADSHWVQSPSGWGLNLTTLWNHDLSWNQESDAFQLSHPGAPGYNSILKITWHHEMCVLERSCWGSMEVSLITPKLKQKGQVESS